MCSFLGALLNGTLFSDFGDSKGMVCALFGLQAPRVVQGEAAFHHLRCPRPQACRCTFPALAAGPALLVTGYIFLVGDIQAHFGARMRSTLCI